MEKISQLMDGELDGQECGAHIRRLTAQPDLARRWDQYHLIRDVLRSEAGTRVDLVASVRARLEAEPTVLAPRRRVQEMTAGYAVPVAAAVAGIVIGGMWNALTQGPSPVATQASTQAKTSLVAAPSPKATPLTPVTRQASGQVKEYILAHQEFSPTSAMQGAASYVRTLSFKDADNGQ
jgi:sigma-E factor negative regulatory protein RseA